MSLGSYQLVHQPIDARAGAQKSLAAPEPLASEATLERLDADIAAARAAMAEASRLVLAGFVLCGKQGSRVLHGRFLGYLLVECLCNFRRTLLGD